MSRSLVALYNRVFRRHETETLLKSMEWKNGSLDVTLKTPFAPIIAAAATQLFKDAGGTNFVTFDFVDYGVIPPRGYTVTIHPHDRLAPEKIAREYEAALKLIVRDTSDDDVERIALSALKKFGRAPKP